MDINQVETAVTNRSKVSIARGPLAGYKGNIVGYNTLYDTARVNLTDANGDIFDKTTVSRAALDLLTTPETMEADKAEYLRALTRGASRYVPDPHAVRKTTPPA
ncbi:hypothetical protein ACFV9E_18285 [Streptomyces sp. NPDC059835]|uniref:hypothetical protein n=1 Tax=Streptomyces sp. NPDC059835 TaxID=3346967 RepID=UPI003655F3DE